MDLGFTPPPSLLLSAEKYSTGHPAGTISGIVIGVLVGLLLLVGLVYFLFFRKTTRYKGISSTLILSSLPN